LPDHKFSDLKFGLRGRLVAVTGGGSGIGRATCELLAADGATVVVLDRNRAGVDAAVSALHEAGAAAHGFAADVAAEDEVEHVVQEIEGTLGAVHGLVVSAGVSTAAPAETLALDEWVRVFNTNAAGAFICCQRFGSRMLARRAGSIVVVGSVDGLGGQPGRTAYASSKFAVHGLVHSLALEWGARGVRINAVAPSFVDTPMLRANIPPTFLEVVVDRTPMARLAEADDIAAAIMMLLSEASRFVNGVILPVDGGLLAGPFTRRSGSDLSSARLLEGGVYRE